MPSFEQWNERFKPYFASGIRIIGEIPLSYEDIEDIALSLKTFIKLNGLISYTTRKFSRYPYSFLTLLSGFASYNTNRDYWQSFADFINVDKQTILNQHWHHKFIELAKEKGLGTFDFSEISNPYVTTIRFQGGIPSYSLPDYFERMILPTINRSSLREAPPKTALEYWSRHAMFVDSPVLNFFDYSGELGEEFFAESCKLALHAKQNHGEILSLESVKLPPYVVSAFESFLERKEDERQHWRKPELLAAPYTEDAAVNLLLPEQEINLDLFTRQISWHVEWEGQTDPIEIKCEVYHHRQSIATDEKHQSIQANPRSITVSIHAYYEETDSSRELRRWSLPLLPPKDQAPLIAFKENRQLIPSGLALPSEPLYVLIPTDTELCIVGEANQIEECPSFIGAWQGWKMEGWNLSKAWSVQVMRGENPVGRVIPIQGIVAQPELIGGHKFQFQDDSDLPLYTSELPSLKFPTSSVGGNFSEINSWQIRIRSLWEAIPSIDKVFTLSQFHSEIKFVNNKIILPISAILGEKPVGIFEIDLRSPRNIRSEFRFRFWPNVFVYGHNLELKQTNENAKASQFILKLQENAKCENQAGSESVKITQNPAGWLITAAPEMSRVLLDLTTPTSTGVTVRVPVMIPMPKLRWALATERAQGVLDFGQVLLNRSIDQILQSGSSSLHIEMYGLGNLIECLSIRLVDISNIETVLQEAKLTRTDFTKDWLRVTLDQFTDSIKNINSLAQFEIVYNSYKNEEELVRIPLMELSRNLNIEKVDLDQVTETSWKLTWKEVHPLKNRRVMIVPSWQPWQEPWEYKIPDEARGESVFEEIALPLSNYELYFYIAPNWALPRKSPPEKLSPFQVSLCDPQERHELLAKTGKTPNEQFKNLIEMANIHDFLGEYKDRDEQLSECAKLLFRLTDLDLLLRSLKWIQSKDIDSSIKSFFFRTMYKIEILGTILKYYELNNPSVIDYLHYTNKVKDIPSDTAKLILKRIDDPIAIHSAVTSLLKMPDADLPRLVVKMMIDSRFSKRDAIELFEKVANWALGKLAEIESSVYSNSLIAGLLPKISQSESIGCNSVISELMLRAIPFEDDEQLVKSYLRCLFIEHHTRYFEMLMKCFTDESISEEEVFEIMSIDPKYALDVLQEAPKHLKHDDWIFRLCEEYPSIAGIVKPGDQLQTPIGIVKIDSIIHKVNGTVNKCKLGDPETSLNVVSGDGAERIRVFIDFTDSKMYIEGQTVVWKCGICGFIHPDQRMVDNHGKAKHRNIQMRFEKISVPIPFEKEKIDVI